MHAVVDHLLLSALVNTITHFEVVPAWLPTVTATSPLPGCPEFQAEKVVSVTSTPSVVV